MGGTMPEMPGLKLGNSFCALQRAPLKIRLSPRILEAAETDPEEVLGKLETSRSGLTTEETERRLRQYGPNVVANESKHGWVRLLLKAIINPLVILLLVLALVSTLT